MFAGRPGIAPLTAGLIASGEIRPVDRILDVGCGTGTEALLLAKWGFRHVVGVDHDSDAIRIARGRVTRARLKARVSFVQTDAGSMVDVVGRRRFDVVLSTLVLNNLDDDAQRDHARMMAAVLRPNGLAVIQMRIFKRLENATPGTLDPPAGLSTYFRLSRGVATHLPERDADDLRPTYAPILGWIGRPKPRRSA